MTAKFIPKEDTQNIINDLLLETGLNRDKTLTKNIRIMDKVKSTNPDVISNIEKIREAIKKNQKIQFDYVKYDISKKLNIDKQSCIVSPYEDVWYQDYYYMLGNYSDDKISHYRVDRIRNIKLLKDKRKNISEIVGIGREFNATEYMSKLIGMSSGNEERVVIRFKNEYIGEVIDSLGEGVTILKDGLSHFTLSARVLVNKKFTRWVLGFGDGALVKSHDNLRNEIIKSVQCQADLYQIETH